MAVYNIIGIDACATGARIRALRRDRKVRVEDICEALGISEQAVYKWQKGAALPSIDNLYALSQIFGVPMDAIVVSVERKATQSFTEGGHDLPSFFAFFAWIRRRLPLNGNPAIQWF